LSTSKSMKRPSPTKPGMVTEEVCTILVPQKLFRIQRSFASRGAENLGGNCIPKLCNIFIFRGCTPHPALHGGVNLHDHSTFKIQALEM